MALPKRKIDVEQEPSREAANDTKPERKKVRLELVVDNTKDEKKYERDRYLKVNKSDTKAFEAFKSRFLRGHGIDPAKLRIMVVGTDRNVSIKEAFPDSEMLFIEEDKQAAAMLRERGLDAEKADYKWRKFSGDEKPDVVVILDEEAEPTNKFMQNIEGHGWVLCRARMAAALRGTGNYEILGAVDKDGVGPSLSKGAQEEHWNEVLTDEEFIAMSAESKLMPGFATFEDAVRAIHDAGIKVREGHVLKTYRELLDASPDSKLKPIPWRTGKDDLMYIAHRIRG